jgi:hypothetical protein
MNDPNTQTRDVNYILLLKLHTYKQHKICSTRHLCYRKVGLRSSASFSVDCEHQLNGLEDERRLSGG